MLIRNIFLLTTLCLIFSAMSCSSDTSSEYPLNDYDRPERNMDRENREDEKQRRDAERAGREEERQRREAEYKKNRESGEHRGQQRHDRDQKEHEFESKPPSDMKMAANELGISPEALRKRLGVHLQRYNREQRNLVSVKKDFWMPLAYENIQRGIRAPVTIIP